MRVNVDGVSLRYLDSYHPDGEGSDACVPSDQSLPLVMLHGFAQGAHTFDDMLADWRGGRRIIRFDLIGHGGSDAPSDDARYLMDRVVDDLDDALRQLGIAEFALLGYSMGGRIALSYTERHPSSVRALILESAGLGPRNHQERDILAKRDTELSQRLSNSQPDDFFDFWDQLPLFASQMSLDPEARERLRRIQLACDFDALSRMMLGCSAAMMPDYRGMLGKWCMPILYIVGDKDLRYRPCYEDVRLLPGVETRILAGGHDLHLENPEGIREVIEGFMARHMDEDERGLR